jgi:hypothetical protein
MANKTYHNVKPSAIGHIKTECPDYKRHLQSIITNPNASVKDKLDAINSDIALNITLMRLEYEGSLFIENYKRNMPLH